MTKPIRFAIVGAGIIGTWHAGVIAAIDGSELAAVVDVVPQRAAELAEAHAAVAATTLAEALAETEIDAVAVCVPSGIHADIAVEALQAGKHVMVEKPVDVDLASVERIRQAHEKAGTTLTVVSQHRFDPSTEALYEAIDAGRLGRLTSGIASVAWWRSQDYYDSGDWRGTWALDGGGALMNQSVHTIDLLLGALGRPTEVSAYADVLAHERIEVEDTAVAILKFASGALGVVHGTTAAAPGMSARLQIHGDRGSAVIDGDRLVTMPVVDPATGEVEELAVGAAAAAPSQTGSNDPGAMSDAHQYQYRNFLKAIAGEEPVRVGLAEGHDALATILAIYESARTGKPVELDA